MAKARSRVSRVLMTGPLAPYATSYRQELEKRRYTRLSAVNQLRQVGRLSRWLETQSLSAADLTVERVDEFLALQRSVELTRFGGHPVG